MNRQLLIVALSLLVGLSGVPAQVPTPPQPLVDTFTGADDTLLTAHTMDAGNGWIGLDNAGTFQIRNNKGQLVGAASGSEAAVAAETGAADVVITADLVSGRNTDATTNNDAGIVFRCGAGGWFLASTNRAAQKIQLFKYSGGYSLVAETACALATDTAYSAKVVTNGTAIAFTVGTTTVSYTDTFNQGATQHGVRIYRDGTEVTPSTVDNFTCTASVASPPTVQKLQYFQPAAGGGGSYVDVSDTLYVLAGKSVSFKAIPAPAGSAFPAGNPVWSGTSGAAGTGATLTVTFAAPSLSLSDSKTVTATCGNTSMTANVVVFELLTVVTPQDNFTGRDLDAWGVCELIDLSYQTLPAGITEYEIGGLKWQIESGGGTLINGTGGIDTYECPDANAIILLSLVVTGGPMLGEKKAEAKPVMEPDGHRMEQKPGTNVYHANGKCSAGFKGLQFATCTKKLSFMKIEVKEGTCKGKGVGYYADIDGLVHTPSAKWYPLDALVADKGYKWTNAEDTVQTGDRGPPFAVGTFTWPIPMMFQKIGATGADSPGTKSYATNTHKQTADALGTATIGKGGVGPFTKNRTTLIALTDSENIGLS